MKTQFTKKKDAQTIPHIYQCTNGHV